MTVPIYYVVLACSHATLGHVTHAMTDIRLDIICGVPLCIIVKFDLMTIRRPLFNVIRMLVFTKCPLNYVGLEARWQRWLPI